MSLSLLLYNRALAIDPNAPFDRTALADALATHALEFSTTATERAWDHAAGTLAQVLPVAA